MAQATATLVSLTVTSVKRALQVAGQDCVKGLTARLLERKAAGDVSRPRSYYSWQYRSHDHQPHMSPRHYRDSPLLCTETGSPPGIHRTEAEAALSADNCNMVTAVATVIPVVMVVVVMVVVVVVVTRKEQRSYK